MGSGRYLTFRYPCSVVTSQETYRILFYYTAYHEDEPGQVGLHSILIMTEALAQEAEIWQWPEEMKSRYCIPSVIAISPSD